MWRYFCALRCLRFRTLGCLPKYELDVAQVLMVSEKQNDKSGEMFQRRDIEAAVGVAMPEV